MNLDQLKRMTEQSKPECKPCSDLVIVRRPVGFTSRLPYERDEGGLVWQESDEQGNLVTMTLTEDGRKVPLDAYRAEL